MPTGILDGHAGNIKVIEWFFRLAEEGLPLRFQMSDAVTATGVNRKAIGKLLRELTHTGSYIRGVSEVDDSFIRDVSEVDDRIIRTHSTTGEEVPIMGPEYVLNIPRYEGLVQRGDVVRKPVAYIDNGWVKQVHSRLSLLVLNHLFRGDQRLSRVDILRLRTSLKSPRASHRVRHSEMNAAIRNLVGLGLARSEPVRHIADFCFYPNPEWMAELL